MRRFSVSVVFLFYSIRSHGIPSCASLRFKSNHCISIYSSFGYADRITLIWCIEPSTLMLDTSATHTHTQTAKAHSTHGSYECFSLLFFFFFFVLIRSKLCTHTHTDKRQYAFPLSNNYVRSVRKTATEVTKNC